jgi:pyrimidine-specific ribonucleoside hydrolase
MHEKIPIIWDMETSDPDDFLTLLLLLDHPSVDLRAITITPGSPDQVGLVRTAVSWFGRTLPIGVFRIDPTKAAVSRWHTDAYGPMVPSVDAEVGAEVLLAQCNAHTTLLTGAPLKNLGAAMQLAEARGQVLRIGRLVAQGGFAGEGVVPAAKQLAKFKGVITCPSFNLNGDPQAALAALVYPGITVRRFVSKNVCHGVIYDQELHAVFAAAREQRRSLELIWRGMDHYLRTKPTGKAFHDPLAACCAIDETIGTWAEVEIYRSRGEWGARPLPGSNTWIIVDYDHARFVQTLLAQHTDGAETHNPPATRSIAAGHGQ